MGELNGGFDDFWKGIGGYGGDKGIKMKSVLMKTY
jgi:hypothetical protein